MAALKVPPPDSQSSYDQPVKTKCRRRVIEHAVKHLTTERETSVCVRRDHVGKVWRQLQETGETNVFSDEERESIEEEISQWELFHKSQVQTREPSDLRVCYLAGDNPTNDLRVLVGLGILPQNVWAVEKNPAMLEKAWESINRSNLRNVRLFKGDILVFLKDFEGQFDIIYFDACGTLPSAKQETLKFIGYVFQFNKLTSPGALITNFSFPPHQNSEAKPTDSERDAIRNLTVGYLMHRLANTLKDDSNYFKENEENRRDRTDEENYSDYITFQVIDSAYLYIPAQRMLSSTKSGKSCPLWDQIFTKREGFIEKVSSDQKTAIKTDSNSKAPFSKSDPTTISNPEGENKLPKTSETRNSWEDKVKELEKFFMPTIRGSYLRHMGSRIQEMSEENNLCKAWIKEVFPDPRLHNNKANIASLLLTHLLSHSFDVIIQFANKDLMEKCLGPLYKALECSGRFPHFCDVPTPQNTTSMVVGLLYGQMAYPSFPVVDKLLRLSYTAKTRQMFSDVFIFDKCRYLYEQFPTVDCSIFALYEEHQQMVFRMVVDGLQKHMRAICKSDVFYCCNVASINACVDGGVSFYDTSWKRLPERQKMEELHVTLDKLKEEGNALVKVEKYEEAMVLYNKYCDLCPHNAVIYANKAHCFLKLNKPEGALSSCKEALELDPRNVKALFRAATACKMLGKYSDAVSYFEKQLRIKEFKPSRKERDECLKLASG